MYNHFGQKWASLHHGPMWSVSKSTQLQGSNREIVKVHVAMCIICELRVFCMQTESDCMFFGLQALVNVPALSERSLRRDIASSGISMDAKIQVKHTNSIVVLCLDSLL